MNRIENKEIILGNTFQWNIIFFIYFAIQNGYSRASVFNFSSENMFVDECRYNASWQWS